MPIVYLGGGLRWSGEVRWGRTGGRLSVLSRRLACGQWWLGLAGQLWETVEHAFQVTYQRAKEDVVFIHQF